MSCGEIAAHWFGLGVGWCRGSVRAAFGGRLWVCCDHAGRAEVFLVACAGAWGFALVRVPVSVSGFAGVVGWWPGAGGLRAGGPRSGGRVRVCGGFSGGWVLFGGLPGAAAAVSGVVVGARRITGMAGVLWLL